MKNNISPSEVIRQLFQEYVDKNPLVEHTNRLHVHNIYVEKFCLIEKRKIDGKQRMFWIGIHEVKQDYIIMTLFQSRNTNIVETKKHKQTEYGATLFVFNTNDVATWIVDDEKLLQQIPHTPMSDEKQIIRSVLSALHKKIFFL